MSDHPTFHQPRKFRSFLNKRVYDHHWKLEFRNRFGQMIFALDPYILHGPDPRDNGLNEIKAVARKIREENPYQRIHSCKISYIGAR